MYKKLIIILVFITIAGTSIAQQEPNSLITLESMPKATIGFPLILKVTVPGPQEVPLFSIFHNDIPVTISFKSKTDAKEYIIISHRQSENYVATMEDGGIINLTNKIYPPIRIAEEQKISMMFDVWALLVGDQGTSLSNIPPGKYTVNIEFETMNQMAIRWNKLTPEQKQKFQALGINIDPVMEPVIKSNSIDIELIRATEKEKKYLSELGNLDNIQYGDSINWAKLLRTGTTLPVDLTELTQISKDQLSFHKLISDVNIVDDKSKNKSIKDVNSASLPEFFESERQLLLLELKDNPTAERKNFLKNYPELKWNVEKLDAGSEIFIVYKENALKIARLRRQSAEQKNPDIPNKPN